MPTPRKRITFPTPIRKKEKRATQTPKKQTTKKSAPVMSPTDENYEDTYKLNTILKDKEIKNHNLKEKVLEVEPNMVKNEGIFNEYLLKIEESRKQEQKLIDSLLRGTNNNALKNFLGLEIEMKNKNTHEFIWCEGQKKLAFLLEEDVDTYNYEYVCAENVNMPEPLLGCINFEKDQLMKFFLNMFEILLARYD